jgi:CelD/BcsL family acetyltransferase involved in cellulose biosynthesis
MPLKRSSKEQRIKISVIATGDLDASLTQKWNHIQGSDDALRSPYYCSEFTRLVAGTGRVVRIAIIEVDGVVQGFFPHEKDSWGRLRPVGGSLNDYHGLIASAHLNLDAPSLLRACGANYFGFNHLPLTQTVFSPYVRFKSVSPVLDLQGGWDAYVERLATTQKVRSPGILATIRASSKRIERDIGALRFEIRESSPRVLETLMQLKSAQWARTMGSSHDPFSVPWIRQLLFNCLEAQGTDFGGSLSTLYAGDKLLACHFGLRARGTLHSWFPVYDPAYAYYQPGLILLKMIAKCGSEEGLSLIDLGRGTADYKMRFRTRVIALGEGAVSSPAILAQAAMSSKLAKGLIKANPNVVRFRQWVIAKLTKSGFS